MLAPIGATGISRKQPCYLQDKNNLQIADLILQWIDRASATEVERPSERRRRRAQPVG